MMRVGEDDELRRGFDSFIQASPSPYHVVESVKNIINKRCFKGECTERNGSSLIAYKYPNNKAKGFHIVCAHSDSPMLKLKENPEIEDGNGYFKLNVEKYGGMALSSWFDRPLSIAGRIVYEKRGKLITKNVDLFDPIYIIPSLAVHMTRGSDEKSVSVQTDLQPIGIKGIMDLLAAYATDEGDTVKADDILGTDLYLYNCEEVYHIGGEDKLYISGPRVDDLQCVYTAARAFAEAESDDYINVLAIFDNEEVGSLSRNGAASDYLRRTLEEIADKLQLSRTEFNAMLDESFMISADNAHGVHPNHPEKADIINRPKLNGGVVIKYHGSQKYTTDAYTGAFVKKLCKDNNIPYQIYHNNSDIVGGSTLGNLIMANVSIPAADIGVAQLAMHSAYETVGEKDTKYIYELIKQFYRL